MIRSSINIPSAKENVLLFSLTKLLFFFYSYCSLHWRFCGRGKNAQFFGIASTPETRQHFPAIREAAKYLEANLDAQLAYYQSTYNSSNSSYERLLLVK